VLGTLCASVVISIRWVISYDASIAIGSNFQSRLKSLTIDIAINTRWVRFCDVGIVVCWVFTHYGDFIWTSQWQFFLYSLGTRK
jgi:hypothetical protein